MFWNIILKYFFFDKDIYLNTRSILKTLLPPSPEFLYSCRRILYCKIKKKIKDDIYTHTDTLYIRKYISFFLCKVYKRIFRVKSLLPYTVMVFRFSEFNNKIALK